MWTQKALNWLVGHDRVFSCSKGKNRYLSIAAIDLHQQPMKYILLDIYRRWDFQVSQNNCAFNDFYHYRLQLSIAAAILVLAFPIAVNVRDDLIGQQQTVDFGGPRTGQSNLALQQLFGKDKMTSKWKQNKLLKEKYWSDISQLL